MCEAKKSSKKKSILISSPFEIKKIVCSVAPESLATLSGAYRTDSRTKSAVRSNSFCPYMRQSPLLLHISLKRTGSRVRALIRLSKRYYIPTATITTTKNRRTWIVGCKENATASVAQRKNAGPKISSSLY